MKWNASIYRETKIWAFSEKESSQLRTTADHVHLWPLEQCLKEPPWSSDINPNKPLLDMVMAASCMYSGWQGCSVCLYLWYQCRPNCGMSNMHCLSMNLCFKFITRKIKAALKVKAGPGSSYVVPEPRSWRVHITDVRRNGNSTLGLMRYARSVVCNRAGETWKNTC